MTWTTNTPHVPGWYWWRFTRQSRPVVRNRDWPAEGWLIFDDGGQGWKPVDGEWVVPLELPQEVPHGG